MHQRAKKYLLLNGKILKWGKRLGIPGLCYHKDLRTAPPFFEINLLKNLKSGEWRIEKVVFYSTRMIFCWQGKPEKNLCS